MTVGLCHIDRRPHPGMEAALILLCSLTGERMKRRRATTGNAFEGLQTFRRRDRGVFPGIEKWKRPATKRRDPGERVRASAHVHDLEGRAFLNRGPNRRNGPKGMRAGLEHPREPSGTLDGTVDDAATKRSPGVAAAEIAEENPPTRFSSLRH